MKYILTGLFFLSSFANAETLFDYECFQGQCYYYPGSVCDTNACLMQYLRQKANGQNHLGEFDASDIDATETTYGE